MSHEYCNERVPAVQLSISPDLRAIQLQDAGFCIGKVIRFASKTASWDDIIAHLFAKGGFEFTQSACITITRHLIKDLALLRAIEATVSEIVVSLAKTARTPLHITGTLSWIFDDVYDDINVMTPVMTKSIWSFGGSPRVTEQPYSFLDTRHFRD